MNKSPSVARLDDAGERVADARRELTVALQAALPAIDEAISNGMPIAEAAKRGGVARQTLYYKLPRLRARRAEHLR